jgi:hypothetical protein
MASTTVAKEKAVPAYSIRRRIALAKFHESERKFTPAAEIWAGLHSETGDMVCLNKIGRLARKAQRLGRHDVAEAMYMILHGKTKDGRYLKLAMAAGEMAPVPFKA